MKKRYNIQGLLRPRAHGVYHFSGPAALTTQDHPIILAKVDAARRRLILAELGRTLNVTVFVALLVSTTAIAVMAIVPLDHLVSRGVTPQQWIAGWLISTFAIALLAAFAWALTKAPSRAEAAAEVDRRFRLSERLSSSLAATHFATRLGGPAGTPVSLFAEALQEDAARSAELLFIAEKFPLAANRVAWLPLSILPILAVMILVVTPASTKAPPSAAPIDSAEVRQVKLAAVELKKRIAEQRRESQAKGLTEAQELFADMERRLDKMTANQALNRKDALIQLNELKDQIQEHKNRVGSSEQLRQTLSQMTGIQGGSMEKIASQIQKGDLGQAADEIRRLAEKLQGGKLNPEEQQRLAEQAKELTERLNAALQKQDQKKADLQKQIDQAKREGRSEEAAKMQQELDQAQAAETQTQQLQQVAEAMQQAADAMQQGDPQTAADALKRISDELSQMQAAMEQLEDLQSTLDDLSQSKEQMTCQKCDGQGCKSCQGEGPNSSGRAASRTGPGVGSGPGRGDGSEENIDRSTYDAQVRGDIQRGRTVISGFADGANRKGVSRETIKAAIHSSISTQSDPLEDQVLPRDEREQTRQYFDRLRGSD